MHASPQQLSHALDRLFDAVSPSLRRASLFTAVSGGADSLSLAHIAQQYADRHGLAHEALVVNHNIRPEAHNEALAVMAELARHDIRAELLAIDMKAPDSAIQHWARQQRFARVTCARVTSNTNPLGDKRHPRPVTPRQNHRCRLILTPLSPIPCIMVYQGQTKPDRLSNHLVTSN